MEQLILENIQTDGWFNKSKFIGGLYGKQIETF